MYQRNRINGFLGAGVVILGLVPRGLWLVELSIRNREPHARL